MIVMSSGRPASAGLTWIGMLIFERVRCGARGQMASAFGIGTSTISSRQLAWAS